MSMGHTVEDIQRILQQTVTARRIDFMHDIRQCVRGQKNYSVHWTYVNAQVQCVLRQKVT